MNWIILLALAGVWLDILVSNIVNGVVGPAVLWIGLMYLVQKQRFFERMLWALSFGAWSLFIAPIAQVLSLVVIFFLASEGLNILFYRLIPEDSKWFRWLTVSIIAVVALVTYDLLLLKSFGMALVLPILLIIFGSIICINYVQKKEK